MQEKNNCRIGDVKSLNLRRILKAKKIKNVVLAQYLGVTPPFISGMLRGSESMGEKVIENLCRVLSVKEKEFYDFRVLSEENFPLAPLSDKPEPPIISSETEPLIPQDVREIFESKDETLINSLLAHVKYLKCQAKALKQQKEGIEEIKSLLLEKKTGTAPPDNGRQKGKLPVRGADQTPTIDDALDKAQGE